MIRISYNVDCKKDKLNTKIKNDKLYLEKVLANITFKRKEKLCYEKCSNKRINKD